MQQTGQGLTSLPGGGRRERQLLGEREFLPPGMPPRQVPKGHAAQIRAHAGRGPHGPPRPGERPAPLAIVKIPSCQHGEESGPDSLFPGADRRVQRGIGEEATQRSEARLDVDIDVPTPVSRMLTVQDEEVGETSESIQARQAPGHVPVLENDQIRSEAAQRLDALPPREECRPEAGQIAEEEEIQKAVLARTAAPRLDDLEVVVDQIRAALHGDDLRLVVEDLQLALEFRREPQIIAVEERHELAARLLDSAVPCRRHSRAVLPDIPYPVPDLPEAIGGVIRRPVVDDDDFQVAEGLSEDALHGGNDRGRLVVRGDHHRDFGHDYRTTLASTRCCAGSSSRHFSTSPTSRGSLMPG